MKKTFATICIIFAVIMSILFMKLKTVQKEVTEIQNFNSAYEYYDRDDLCGAEVTTVINKAIDNNEKYDIEKSEEGYYDTDDENSIEIYVTMIINGSTYPMESLINAGLDSFTEYFGEVNFKCTDIKYHESTGKISQMTFESTEY